jgi:carotenoid cleavage dioxygenase-like enzyme
VEFPKVAVDAPSRSCGYAYAAMHAPQEAARGIWDRVAKVDVERDDVVEIDFGPAR